MLREGDGDDHPTVSSPCECHYAGTTPSLTPDAIELDEAKWSEFDSSYKRGSPTSFAPNQVIKGWTEAMQLMVEGDKWEMYIPSEMGYGDGGSGAKIKDPRDEDASPPPQVSRHLFTSRRESYASHAAYLRGAG